MHICTVTRYSEGPGLTKSDEKAYWGKIEERELDYEGDGINNGIENESGFPGETVRPKRLEIKGTIFWGWGLEPVPEGIFTMVEKMCDESTEEEEEDDEDDEDDEDLFDISTSTEFE